MAKSRSEELTDYFCDLADIHYEEYMTIASMCLDDKNILNLILYDENGKEKTRDKMVKDFRGRLERAVLTWLIVKIIDDDKARSDFMNLVKGSELEKRMPEVYRMWDPNSAISNKTLEEWIEKPKSGK